jgi:membrane fusion protein (multidrug efflux system)
MSDRGSRRFLLRLVLLIVIPLGAIAAAGYVYLTGGRYVTTENAYVKTDIIQISADVEGRVTAINVHDHDRVKAGDVLFKVDAEPFRIDMAQAEAELMMIGNEIASMRAEYREAGGELSEAQERSRFLKRQAERLKNLHKRGATTVVRLDQAEHDLALSRQRIRVIRQKMQRVLAGLGGNLDIPVEKHPKYLEAKTERDEALLNLSRTVVYAAADGVVTNVKLQAGEYVKIGTPVFSLIAANKPWVEANLKETELTYVREGQQVMVVVDAYPDIEWRAVVDTISPATGAEFAVLPPQNATGNWVKVVQRLPVHIRLHDRPGNLTLRAGMTVSVSIDTKREREMLTIIRSGWAKILEPK